MKAGKLRHLVTIQEPVRVDDGRGGKTTTYSDKLDTWAGIEPITGREYFLQGQLAHGVTHRIAVRLDPDQPVKAKYRVKHGARTYEILAVRNLEERDRELELMAQELAN